MVSPAIWLRGFFWEEGRHVGIARTAIADDQWLTAMTYGARFIDRPYFSTHLSSLLSFVTGALDEFTLRLPVALAVLATMVMVFALTRRHASQRAAMFAALCVLASPQTIARLTLGEPDAIVAMFVFAAFMTWWLGVSAGTLTPARGAAVGALLACAGLSKAPHFIAYFSLGVAIFTAWRRRWRDLPGLILAHAIAGVAFGAWYVAVYQPGDATLWLGHARLLTPESASVRAAAAARFIAVLSLELLPALIPAALSLWRLARADDANRDLSLALLLCAGACSLVLAAWPGANGRYTSSAIPLVACAAGLGFDRLWAGRRRLMAGVVAIMGALMLYRAVLGWVVMPLWPEPFARNRANGQAIAALVGDGPVVIVGAFGTGPYNAAAYLNGPLREIALDDVARLALPARILAAAGLEGGIAAARPDARARTLFASPRGDPVILIELTARTD